MGDVQEQKDGTFQCPQGRYLLIQSTSNALYGNENLSWGGGRAGGSERGEGHFFQGTWRGLRPAAGA